ncbi:hypothetical protein QCA50_006421 [Cerrena zonata]|uniref:Uncharacterized protein n=1 Tax=Cerrena zonata TaxID=2478898 RepID=A0AAW0GBE5_9APHY
MTLSKKNYGPACSFMIRCFFFFLSFLIQTDYHRIVSIISIALGFGRFSFPVDILFLERISPLTNRSVSLLFMICVLCSCFTRIRIPYDLFPSCYSEYLSIFHDLFLCIQFIAFAFTPIYSYNPHTTFILSHLRILNNTSFHPSNRQLLDPLIQRTYPHSSFHVLSSISFHAPFRIWKHIFYHTLSY